METGTKISRRTFIAAGAAAAVSVGAGKSKKGKKASANELLNIACVGVGGRGSSDLSAVAHENIVALCDVDQRRAAQVFRAFPDTPKYSDWRVMLEKQHDIDAVVIATPDHMHAFIASAAMQLGKHVYVEKPMAHSVEEARRLVRIAGESGVATQMGNQGHSMYGVWQLVHMLETGIIGAVREVHAWTDRPHWPQGLERPTETPPVPAELDWEMWLGSAPERPYHSCYLPHNWRGWWDFGCCALGDMGCHVMDPAYTALKLGAPTRVSAESSGVNSETGPLSSTIRYEFPARGSMPPVTLTWYDGKEGHPAIDGVPADAPLGDADGGSLLVGEKGMIQLGTYGAKPTILDPSLMQEYEAQHPERMEGKSHHRTWIEACKGGPAALSNFEYAGPFTEVVLLGNVALRAGQPIEWDSENMRVSNLPEADRLIRLQYRDGWTL